MGGFMVNHKRLFQLYREERPGEADASEPWDACANDDSAAPE
jgi:hypothetical protein